MTLLGANARSLRSAQTLSRRLAVFALALAVLVASAAGGVRFQWCTMAARAQLHCCCPPPAGPVAAQRRATTAAVSAASCCEGRSVESLPPATARADSPDRVAAAPLVAILPIVLWLAHAHPGHDEPPAIARANLPRAGPEPPLYDLHRRYLI
jgi:hypothetical protein